MIIYLSLYLSIYISIYLGARDADRHPEADPDRQGREHQEVAGDAPEQGRRYSHLTR